MHPRRAAILVVTLIVGSRSLRPTRRRALNALAGAGAAALAPSGVSRVSARPSSAAAPATTPPPCAAELYERVKDRRPETWSPAERVAVERLVDEVVALRAPWPADALVGTWRLAYLQNGPGGAGVDRRVPFPELPGNEQYQIFSGAAGGGPSRVTNVGEVLGPSLRVEVKGALREADAAVTRSPKRFTADIDSGALCAPFGCAPLPISGLGEFDGVYLDDRLRVGQNLNGGGARVVQVRVR